MLFEFLVVGGVLFWVMLGLASCFLIACVEGDNNSWGVGLVVIVACLVLLLLFGDLREFTPSRSWLLPVSFLGYLAIGVCWTIPRWVLLLRSLRVDLSKVREDFKKSQELLLGEEIPSRLYALWADCVNQWRFGKYGISVNFETGVLTPPTFLKNRDRLITWAVLWPWSMFWSLCRDVVVAVVETIIDWWGGAYQRLSNYFFKDF